MSTEPIPVVRYAARSAGTEETDIHDSTEGQVRLVDDHLATLDGRVIVGDPHIDYASGSKRNRGPGLAAAIEAATAAADEYGAAELWVAHSSRLGRGTGQKGQARALGHLLYQLRAVGVSVRSVGDDEFTTNEQLWGIASNQAAKYSLDLSAHVRRGYREVARRGDASWLFRGIRLGGYEPLRSFDAHGRVTIQAIKHSDDAWIYELMFGMALEGRSIQAIQLELSARGAQTRPSRKDHQPRPFDINRISQTLDNPSYAGLLTHQGQIVGPGNWPRYLEPEDFYRLREERRQRAHTSSRRAEAGRPPVAPYLLQRLAVCGQCGRPMRVETGRRRARTRRYVCQSHRNNHRDSAEFCPATPFDAVEVDRIVLRGIDGLVKKGTIMRQRLLAARDTEVARLTQIAAAAQDERARAEATAVKADARFARALADDEDEDTQDIILTAARLKRAEARSAETRLDAALGALSAVAQENEDPALIDRLSEVLAGRIEDAAGDVPLLNAILREMFTAYELQRGPHGDVYVYPIVDPRVFDGNSPLTSTNTRVPWVWAIRSSSPQRVRWLRSRIT